MFCCENTIEELGRQKFKQKREPQPLKFRLLSMIGLKKYLIDKFVFVRRESKYEMKHLNGENIILTPYVFLCSACYQYSVQVIENEHQSIPMVYLRLKDRSRYKATLIYSHGNSSDLSDSLNFINKFSFEYPFLDYVVYDYTGYGISTKTDITEDSICNDLDTLIKHLGQPTENVILWGFSLGTYPTVAIAAKYKMKGVILQSPLASIYSLFTDNLSAYSTFKNDCFSVLQKISALDCFLICFHSTDDEVIPFHHSKVIYDRHRMLNSNTNCYLVEVGNLKHNEMHKFFYSKFQNQLKTTLLKYLQMMIDSGEIQLQKGEMLQIVKEKYFSEALNDVEQSEVLKVDVEIDQREEPLSKMIAEAQFKREVADLDCSFEDIGNEEMERREDKNNHNKKDHQGYFVGTEDYYYESEVSSIKEEQLVQQYYS